MEVLAFDYGDSKIGYAVASKTMKLAFAKSYIQNDSSLKESLMRLIAIHRPKELVIGLPLRQNLDFTPATDKALLFSKYLFQLTDLPLYLVDERYSTVYSQTSLRYAGRTVKNSKEIIDSESAKSIAEVYLQSPAWVYRFNLNCLSESVINKYIRSNNTNVFYFMGGKDVLEIMSKFQKEVTIYELNPYFYSLERNKKLPKNVKNYGFKFSVPAGFVLYQ